MLRRANHVVVVVEVHDCLVRGYGIVLGNTLGGLLPKILEHQIQLARSFIDLDRQHVNILVWQSLLNRQAGRDHTLVHDGSLEWQHSLLHCAELLSFRIVQIQGVTLHLEVLDEELFVHLIIVGSVRISLRMLNDVARSLLYRIWPPECHQRLLRAHGRCHVVHWCRLRELRLRKALRCCSLGCEGILKNPTRRVCYNFLLYGCPHLRRRHGRGTECLHCRLRRVVSRQRPRRLLGRAILQEHSTHLLIDYV